MRCRSSAPGHAAGTPARRRRRARSRRRYAQTPGLIQVASAEGTMNRTRVACRTPAPQEVARSAATSSRKSPNGRLFQSAAGSAIALTSVYAVGGKKPGPPAGPGGGPRRPTGPSFPRGTPGCPRWAWCPVLGSAPGGGGTGTTVGCPVRTTALGDAALGDGEAVAAGRDEGAIVAGRCCPGQHGHMIAAGTPASGRQQADPASQNAGQHHVGLGLEAGPYAIHDVGLTARAPAPCDPRHLPAQQTVGDRLGVWWPWKSMAAISVSCYVRAGSGVAAFVVAVLVIHDGHRVL